MAIQPQASSSMSPSGLDPVREHLASHIIGQHKLIDGMLVCLLSDGHMLVEGMPGLAKTTAVNTLSEAIEGDFHRVVNFRLQGRDKNNFNIRPVFIIIRRNIKPAAGI